MMIKTAAEGLQQAMQAVREEQLENIKIAHHNAKCAVKDMKPYKSAAFMSLTTAARQLIDLATEPQEQ